MRRFVMIAALALFLFSLYGFYREIKACNYFGALFG